jgi:hypothetical protein
MTPKGKLSPELSAVLRNKEARGKLRHVMDEGGSLTVRIGETTYRVSSLRNKGGAQRMMSAKAAPPKEKA